MKLTVTEDLGIQLEEVFSGLTLKTESGETMSICMRDTGFEFNYQGKWYFAKEGFVEPFKTSIRGNYLVEQKHDGSVDCLPQSNLKKEDWIHWMSGTQKKQTSSDQS